MRKLSIAIGTRERPEYLAALLASIAAQSEEVCEIFIYPNGSDSGHDELKGTVASRMIDLLRENGIPLTVYPLGNGGRSAANWRNAANLNCSVELLLLVDDDMYLEQGYLKRMISAFSLAEADAGGAPVILSGTVPWVDSSWKTSEIGKAHGIPPEGTKMVQIIRSPENIVPFKLNLRYHKRFDVAPLNLGAQSAAVRLNIVLRPADMHVPENHLMRPYHRIMQWDTMNQGVYSDMAWALQLALHDDFKFFVELGSRAFHLNAPSGGVRLPGKADEKPEASYQLNAIAVGKLLQDLEVKNASVSVHSNRRED